MGPVEGPLLPRLVPAGGHSGIILASDLHHLLHEHAYLGGQCQFVYNRFNRYTGAADYIATLHIGESTPWKSHKRYHPRQELIRENVPVPWVPEWTWCADPTNDASEITRNGWRWLLTTWLKAKVLRPCEAVENLLGPGWYYQVLWPL